MQLYRRKKKKNYFIRSFPIFICEKKKKPAVQCLILKSARKIPRFNSSRIPSEQIPQFRSGSSKHCCPYPPKIFNVLLKSFKKKCCGTS